MALVSLTNTTFGSYPDLTCLDFSFTTPFCTGTMLALVRFTGVTICEWCWCPLR